MKVLIEDTKEIEEILERAQVGRLGLADGEEPYVVPLNFIYDNGHIYFHSGVEGRKLDIIKKNPRVCFEVDEMSEVFVNPEGSCFSTAYYKSVIAVGTARLLDADDEKIQALDLLMKKYAAGREYEAIPEHAMAIVGVCEIKIDKMAGKASVPDDASD